MDWPCPDIIYFPRIALAVIIGAFLCLDRIALQLMVSRPVVAAPMVGLVLGNPFAGLLAGALVEIFWVNKSPLGTYAPPNETVAAVVIAMTTIITGEGRDYYMKEVLVLSVLVCLPLGHLSQSLERVPARFNLHMSERALRNLDGPDEYPWKKVSLLPSLLFYFLFSLSFIVAGFLVSLFIIKVLLEILPSFAFRGLHFLFYVLPLIGVAVVLTTTRHKKSLAVFLGVFAVAVLLVECMRFL